MKCIKRIELEVEKTQKLSLPFNSEILGFDKRDGKPCLFVLMDDSMRPIERTIHIIADGKEVGQAFNRTNFLGSFWEKDHLLHVFQDC